MIAAFSKKIAMFPCQTHTTIFHTSAPLVNLMNKQLPACPQWKLGTVKKLYTTNGQILIKCDEEDSRGRS